MTSIMFNTCLMTLLHWNDPSLTLQLQMFNFLGKIDIFQSNSLFGKKRREISWEKSLWYFLQDLVMQRWSILHAVADVSITHQYGHTVTRDTAVSNEDRVLCEAYQCLHIPLRYPDHTVFLHLAMPVRFQDLWILHVKESRFQRTQG